MHVVQLEDGRVEVSSAVRRCSVLCVSAGPALDFEQVEDTLKREVLLTIGAR
jgi:hypothetical protein